MVGVIAAFALVHPAALVDAADVFTQAIQDILRVHGIREAVRFPGEIWNRFHRGYKRTHHAFGIKWVAVLLFVNQGSFLPNKFTLWLI